MTDKFKTLILFLAFCIILGVTWNFAYGRGYSKAEKEVSARYENLKPKTETVYVPVKGDTETIIKYTPATDYEKANNVGLEFNSEPTKVSAVVNGKLISIPTTPETGFSQDENGVWRLSQSSEVKIDVTSLANAEIEKERKALIKKYNKPNEFKAKAISGTDTTYLGLEYEAKLWEVGAYKRIRGNTGDDTMYSVGYTLARW